MRQATLKFKNYANSISITDNSYVRRRLFRVILTTFGFLSVCYILVMAGIVFNIVERKSLESQARNLSTSVGELELAYLSGSGAIDLSLSQTYGFQEVRASFATRKPLLGAKSVGEFGSLRFINNEI